MRNTLRKMIYRELLAVQSRYNMDGPQLLRTAPLYLVDCEDSLQDLNYELVKLERKLEECGIFEDGAGDVLELFSAYRPKGDSFELGFQNRAGEYLPGYEEWMQYISQRMNWNNAVVALHIRDTDPEAITPQGWKNLWRCAASYKAHCLVLIIVDSDTKEAVIRSFGKSYFYRVLAYNPLTAEEKVEYFLTSLDAFGIFCDRDQVEETLLQKVKASEICGQREISFLLQSVVWGIGLREEPENTETAGDSLDETAIILRILNAEENKIYFFDENHRERTMGFR